MTLWLATTCATLLLQQPAQGGSEPIRIATINIAEVFDKYEMTRGLEDRFERERQASAEQAQTRRAELDAKARAIVEQFKPDTREFEERQLEYLRSESEFQIWADYEKKRLAHEHKRWLRTIYRNVRDMVRQISEARGIDVVLTYDQLSDDAPDSNALRQQILLQKVIYSSPRVDLTREVTDRLNQEFQKSGGAGAISPTAPAGSTNPATPAKPPGNQ